MSELIAEARVLVTPDTTGFRALLTTEVAAASKGVTVPIAVTPVITGVDAAAQRANQQLVSGAVAGQSNAKIASSASAASAAQSQMAKTADLVAAAEKRAAVASTEVSAANLRYTAALGASEAAQRAYQIALASTDESLRLQSGLVVAITAENEALALSNLQLAQSENEKAAATAKTAASLGGVSKGAGSAIASLTGVRGATLAATGPFLAGAAAVITLTASLKSFAGLQTSLNTFQVTAGATAEEMQKISDTAHQLGSDLSLPGVTASSAADALAQLSRAGLSVEDSLSGVRGTLQLATAAAIDNETAVTLVASALNAFQLSGTDAAKVADLLAASSKESQGSIEDVGLALQQSAAAAAQAGVSVQDTVALLTELGRAGLRGSDAGTSLRVALIRLINPSKKAQEALDRLGVSIRDEAGNVRAEAFTDIATQLEKLTKAQRDATLAVIFGQDAFRAAAIIGREGARGLNEMRDATQETGVAAQLASARTKGLAGSFENLKNQGSALGLSIGEALAGPTQDFVDILAGGIANINSFIDVLNRSDDQAKVTGESFHNLAIRAAEIRVAQGDAAAEEFLKHLESDANQTAIAYTNLIIEAGKLNVALAARGDKAGQQLRDDTADLNKQLEATLPAALVGKGGLEEYAAAVHNVALEEESLRNRIDETNNRFAQPLPTPQAPKPPPGIGPQAKLQAADQLAQSQGDLQESERIEEQILANARKAFQNSHGNIQQRTALFNAQASAEAQLNATRRQISEQSAADAKKTAATVEQNRKAAADAAAKQKAADDAAFLQTQEDARGRRERLVGLADETEGLADDIKRRQGLRVLITNQINAIRASALSEDAKREAIKTLAKARQATTDEINRLVATDRTQKAAQRQQLAEETLTANEALAQSIFDLTGNKNPLLKAIDAEIKNQTAVRNKAKKGSLEATQAQTEVNNLLVKRRNLLKSADDAAKQASQGFSGFEFLQKTQGFASNLLGNLIPGFATAGLVGNQSATAGQITDPRTVMLGDDVVTGNRLNDRGVRPVQVDTTNALLRQILRTLNGKANNPPEIQQNWRTAFAELDTL